jgi:DNA-binding CsgD family transcriptional regulator
MGNARNTFERRRQELETSEGRSLSDWDIATLLDCSKRHVDALMSRPDEDVRPAYVLALEYAREVGLDACGAIFETPPEEFDRLLDEVTLTRTEVARMMGIDRHTLHHYTLPERELDVPRHYYLALLYIHHLYASGEEPAECRQHIETYASA